MLSTIRTAALVLIGSSAAFVQATERDLLLWDENRYLSPVANRNLDSTDQATRPSTIHIAPDSTDRDDESIHITPDGTDRRGVDGLIVPDSTDRAERRFRFVPDTTDITIPSPRPPVQPSPQLNEEFSNRVPALPEKIPNEKGKEEESDTESFSTLTTRDCKPCDPRPECSINNFSGKRRHTIFPQQSCEQEISTTQPELTTPLTKSKLLAEYGGGYGGMLIGSILGSVGGSVLADLTKAASSCTSRCGENIKNATIVGSAAYFTTLGVNLLGADYGEGGVFLKVFTGALIPALLLPTALDEQQRYKNNSRAVLYSMLVPAGAVIGFNMERYAVIQNGTYSLPNKKSQSLHFVPLFGGSVFEYRWEFD